MPLFGRWSRPTPVLTIPWVIVAAYFLVFLLLDWVSFIRPLQGLNITPWNPQPALAVALLLLNQRLWWAVLLSLLTAELLVRGMPGDLFVVVATATALTCSYAAMASALQQLFGRRHRLNGAPGVVVLLVVVAAGALLNGLVYVGVYAASGFLPAGPAWQAVARYWVGDAVGLTVTLPILLVAMDPVGRARLWRTLVHRLGLVIGVVIVLLCWWVFGRGAGAFDFSYLLLLPVIAASMRFGVPGAVLACALTQLGLIFSVQIGSHQDLLVFELQMLLVIITITAILLGVVVDERARVDAELRRSLRLAAAGQMTAALAHELSQPLNALTLYAQALELLAPDGTTPGAARQQQWRDVVHRMAADARRAGDVVRRLRDFFRSGATHLEWVTLQDLVQEALAAQQERADAVGTRLSADLAPGIRPLWVDRVQLQVVLRNLLANALDAAAPTGVASGASVSVSARTLDAEVLVEVKDTGPGLDAAQVQALFDSQGSDKAGGMGVGLGICRAIVEAHGGRLWAVPGRQGRLCFTLPDVRPAGRESDDHVA